MTTSSADVLPDEPGAEIGEVRIACRGLGKVFGSNVAVSDTSFDIRDGEMLALVGENGAGKSTCVKMLGGIYHPDRGEIVLDGDPVAIASPLDASSRGIAVVHQHPSLFGELSIAENIFTGHLITDRFGLVDHAAMRHRAAEVLATLGVHHDLSVPARGLRTSEQQLIEIARALVTGARVLILDEPTAALTTSEVERLFAVIKELKARGVAMMFVGHRLEEIFEISERIVVMRDGTDVAHLITSETDRSEVVQHMIGREVQEVDHRSFRTEDTVLKLDGLTVDGEFSDISVNVHAGEVVGLGGLVGAGRTEIARAIFGVTRPSNGRIVLDGEPVDFRSPADAIAAGVAYVSEDRRGQSIVEEFAILDNASLPTIAEATRSGLINRRAELANVSEPLDRMELRFQSYLQPINSLSGGNQQKVVLAKWLATNPRLLILDEPTQGIDVGSKAEVHKIIAELAESGIAVLVISSDMPELISVSDRVYVLRHGELTAELVGDNITPINIGMAATGADQDGSGTEQDGSGAEQDRSGTDDELDAAEEHRPSAWRRILRSREAGLALAMICVIAPLTIINPNFYQASNLRDLFIYASLIGIVGLGQMLVIVTRNIDLSVASMLGLSAYVAASTMRDSPGLPVVVGVVVAIAVGLVCGVINGLLVAYGNVPSIVVTLGTLAVYRGILSWLSSGDRVVPEQVSDSWISWTTQRPFGLPIIALIGAALAVVVAFALRRTRVGREIFASGSNPEGAELVGIRVKRRILLAFTMCGVLAGFVGAMWASYYPYVDGQVAFGLELTVISGVVVGGVALRGGVGTVTGVVLGTVGLLAIRKALTIAGVDDRNLQAIYGAAIIVAVSVDVLVFARGRRGGAT